VATEDQNAAAAADTDDESRLDCKSVSNLDPIPYGL